MNIKSVFKGTLISFLVTFLALFISAVLVYFCLITERTASVIVFAAAVVGVFISAFGAARVNDRRLFFNSVSVAILFALILLITSCIINNSFVFHTRTLALICAVLTSGIAGFLFGK